MAGSNLIFLLFWLSAFSAVGSGFSLEVAKNTPKEVESFLGFSIQTLLEDYQADGWTQEKMAEEHSKQLGASVLPSGVQIKKLKRSTEGGASPGPESFVEVDYRGITFDGKSFYDSWKEGSSTLFKVSHLVKGWQEVMLKMSEGDIVEAFVPANLAYGENGVKGTIPPNSDLIFIIQLLKVDPELSLWLKTQLLLKDDFPIPPFKNYHLIVFGLYILFRKMTSKLTEYMFGKTNRTRRKASARHILFDINDKEQAEKVLKQLKKDVSKFEELAKEHSKCPSGQKGGDLGWFSEGQMVPEFDKVIFNEEIQLNEVVGPVSTDFGHHLIIVMERDFPEAKKDK